MQLFIFPKVPGEVKTKIGFFTKKKAEWGEKNRKNKGMLTPPPPLGSPKKRNKSYFENSIRNPQKICGTVLIYIRTHTSCYEKKKIFGLGWVGWKKKKVWGLIWNSWGSLRWVSRLSEIKREPKGKVRLDGQKVRLWFLSPHSLWIPLSMRIMYISRTVIPLEQEPSCSTHANDEIGISK